MSQRDFFRLWFWLRPRNFPRAKWYDLADVIHWTWATVTMPFCHPKWWIFFRACELANYFDQPPPKPPQSRGVLRA